MTLTPYYDRFIRPDLRAALTQAEPTLLPLLEQQAHAELARRLGPLFDSQTLLYPPLNREPNAAAASLLVQIVLYLLYMRQATPGGAIPEYVQERYRQALDDIHAARTGTLDLGFPRLPTEALPTRPATVLSGSNAKLAWADA